MALAARGASPQDFTLYVVGHKLHGYAPDAYLSYDPISKEWLLVVTLSKPVKGGFDDSSWEVDIPRSHVKVNTSTISVRANYAGRFGAFHIHFSAKPKLSSTKVCGKHSRYADGAAGGEIVIRTGTKLETIQISDLRATATVSPPQTCSVSRCGTPVAAVAVFSSDSPNGLSLDVDDSPGQPKSATLYYSLANPGAFDSVGASLHTTKGVRMSWKPDLASASASVSGAFAADLKLAGFGTTSQSSERCSNGHTYTISSRAATVTSGSVHAKLDIFGAVTEEAAKLTGSLQGYTKKS